MLSKQVAREDHKIYYIQQESLSSPWVIGYQRVIFITIFILIDFFVWWLTGTFGSAMCVAQHAG